MIKSEKLFTESNKFSSKFALSFDNLLRIFGGKEIKKLFRKFEVPDDMPFDSDFLDKVIDNSQKKVEDSYYEIRKRLLDYDKIIHVQRLYIYKKRRIILNSINLREEMISYGEDLMFKFAQKLEKIKNQNITIEFEQIDKEIASFLGIPYLFSDFNLLKILTFNEIKQILIQQFWIQEINSKIYVVTEQRNMIVNQVPKHQF